jgi:hypothetical protein
MYNGPTFANEWSPNGKPPINIFLHFLPCYFLKVTIVEATSNMLLTANAVWTTLGELFRYIGMMLLMTCYIKLPDYFWKTATRTGNESEDEANNIPFFIFNRYMSWRPFWQSHQRCDYPQTTAIIPRQVLADSGFVLDVERAHAYNLQCSMGFMP